MCLNVIYGFFGLFNYLVYGAAHLADPLITSDIPEDTIVVVTEILFIGMKKSQWLSPHSSVLVNLILTYPLQMHPPNMVLEGAIFKGYPKSRKRTWLKNILRTFLVALTIVVGLSLRSTLDKLMSVVGSLTCAPIAFIFPSMFHYKLMATTRRERVTDLIIATIGTILMIGITIYTLVTWNED